MGMTCTWDFGILKCFCVCKTVIVTDGMVGDEEIKGLVDTHTSPVPHCG